MEHKNETSNSTAAADAERLKNRERVAHYRRWLKAQSVDICVLAEELHRSKYNDDDYALLTGKKAPTEFVRFERLRMALTFLLPFAAFGAAWFWLQGPLATRLHTNAGYMVLAAVLSLWLGYANHALLMHAIIARRQHKMVPGSHKHELMRNLMARMSWRKPVPPYIVEHLAQEQSDRLRAAMAQHAKAVKKWLEADYELHGKYRSSDYYSRANGNRSSGRYAGSHSSGSYDTSFNAPIANPANGLPMVGGMGGVDAAGNAFGSNNC